MGQHGGSVCHVPYHALLPPRHKRDWQSIANQACVFVLMLLGSLSPPQETTEWAFKHPQPQEFEFSPEITTRLYLLDGAEVLLQTKLLKLCRSPGLWTSRWNCSLMMDSRSLSFGCPSYTPHDWYVGFHLITLGPSCVCLALEWEIPIVSNIPGSPYSSEISFEHQTLPASAALSLDHCWPWLLTRVCWLLTGCTVGVAVLKSVVLSRAPGGGTSIAGKDI